MNKKIVFAGIIIAGISSAFIARKMVGVDLSSMDKTVSPANDFYEYANGTWCKNNPVPPAEARWTSFNVLAERNNDMLKKILEDAANNTSAPMGSATQKIGDFYKAAMDSNRLNAERMHSLQREFMMIKDLKSSDDVIRLLALFHRRGIPALFSFDVSQDVKKNKQCIIYLSQGGLGMPDRDYYLKSDEKSLKIIDEYKRYMMQMFIEQGGDPSLFRTKTTDIYNLEEGLARVSMTRVERRDMEKQYNKYTLLALKKYTPAINWELYLGLAGVPKNELREIIVSQPDFFTYMDRLFIDTKIDQWKSYFEWKLMNAAAPYMGDKYNDAHFRFYGTVMNGTQEQKPRWKRVVNSANALIGDIVAQEYVKVAFSEDSKKRINEMVDNLREAFKKRIEQLDWMSPETKTKALQKLASFNRKLGYPDKWKDYSGLQVTKESYLSNYYRANEFGHNEMIQKLSKPIDKTEWEMLPQTVNAYYNPVMNEIVFPAAIMQPPFFNPAADDAVNYGAIGAVIGHEFSHGFDDQGSKFDATGNMNNWWTEEDKTKFENRTQMLSAQYSKFSVEDNVFVNGQLTLGENIADLAGLTVAYDAYQMSLAGKKHKKIDGFTAEQRFFIGFAQVWKNNARAEYLRQQVMTDPHSPGRFRVIGPLSNMPQFYSAFAVKPGNKMYIEENQRVKIW